MQRGKKNAFETVSPVSRSSALVKTHKLVKAELDIAEVAQSEFGESLAQPLVNCLLAKQNYFCCG